MKKITALIFGVFLMTTGLAFAQQASSVEQSTVQPVEVGNKHCPVSGKEVGQMGPPVKIEYNGKVYNLCCPGCKNTFNSGPEKYSKIAEDDAKAGQSNN
jgi:YHS domain-containing protein